MTKNYRQLSEKLGNLRGMDKDGALLSRLKIGYSRERLAFLAMVFMLGASVAVVILTIINLIRYDVMVI